LAYPQLPPIVTIFISHNNSVNKNCETISTQVALN